ncbi:MAG: hypothetical protein ABIU08_24670 [Acidimicrobiales bacterium]
MDDDENQVSLQEDALHQWARLRGFLMTSQSTSDGTRYNLWGPHDPTLVLHHVDLADVERFLSRV